MHKITPLSKTELIKIEKNLTKVGFLVIIIALIHKIMRDANK